MATPVGPAGTASQVVSIPPAEQRPDAERPDADRVKETADSEAETATRRERPDTDSSVGNNIDTTA